MMGVKKQERKENIEEEMEFENTFDYAVTMRKPTKAYGRKLPPCGGSIFIDIKPGERITLPIDRGRKLQLTPVKKLPKQDKKD